MPFCAIRSCGRLNIRCARYVLRPRASIGRYASDASMMRITRDGYSVARHLDAIGGSGRPWNEIRSQPFGRDRIQCTSCGEASGHERPRQKVLTTPPGVVPSANLVKAAVEKPGIFRDNRPCGARGTRAVSRTWRIPIARLGESACRGNRNHADDDAAPTRRRRILISVSLRSSCPQVRAFLPLVRAGPPE